MNCWSQHFEAIDQANEQAAAKTKAATGQGVRQGGGQGVEDWDEWPLSGEWVEGEVGGMVKSFQILNGNGNLAENTKEWVSSSSAGSTSTTPPAAGVAYSPVGGVAYPSNMFSYKELVVKQMGGPCFAETAILTPVDRLPGVLRGEYVCVTTMICVCYGYVYDVYEVSTLLSVTHPPIHQPSPLSPHPTILSSHIDNTSFFLLLPPGSNTVGMIAWLVTMKTPQYPEGRQIVLIANDVTVQVGSFSEAEDQVYFKASEYAREHGLPRVFISCNSGARIGLVDELKPLFKVAWKDDANPSLGFDYLYLTPRHFESLPQGTVDAVKMIDERTGETRYRLAAILGVSDSYEDCSECTGAGIGVENLRGSGLIAGETSRAYDETFTLSYVTGR